MIRALITRKIGMTSTIAPDGTVRAVTILSAAPNIITQIKTIDTDGYSAVQIGAGEVKKLSKPQAGHLKGSKSQAKVLKEFRVSETADPDLAVGGQINLEAFAVGDKVDVTGTSKGKGWAGTIKRHKFKRGRKTHGGRSYREVGSIGSMYPQKIFKGKRMAGRMGSDKVTVKRLPIAIIDNELQVIGVFGAVPGPRRGLVLIKGAK